MSDTGQDEIDDVLAELGVDRRDVDAIVDICAQAFLSGMTDEQVTDRIRGWIEAEKLRRRGASKPATLH